MTRARDVANIDGLLTTTGDTYYASAAGTPARLGIGSTSQVLTVSGGVPAWSAAPGGTWSQSATGSLTGSSVTISSLSGKQYYVLCKGWSHSASSEYVQIRFNGDTGTNYWRGDSDSAVAELYLNGGGTVGGASTRTSGFMVDMANTSMSFKPMLSMTPTSTNGSVSGWYQSSSAITSITLFPSGGTFDAGTYYVWSFA